MNEGTVLKDQVKQRYEKGYRQGYVNALLDIVIEVNKATKEYKYKSLSTNKLRAILKSSLDSAGSVIVRDNQLTP